METKKEKQSVFLRAFWFVVGGALSPSLDTANLWIFTTLLHVPKNIGYAISILISASLFFLWNYFVNFRTGRVWKECIGRYLVAFAICQGLTYFIGIACINAWGSNWTKIWFINYAVKTVTGGMKFLLYHFWVFPHGKGAQPQPAVSEAA